MQVVASANSLHLKGTNKNLRNLKFKGNLSHFEEVEKITLMHKLLNLIKIIRRN